ncbi:hypothetical protein [Burkholderia cenocepacia]|uniref:hypothetical protein n=1 Tax=Burkholderia cenocepacia TaxID=95486 RepID=UPI0026509574|nr:hypothetical protein [Burkholderia cenocepacia]MDN7549118.1 hypothetical protein [Burkholderia cenocepacia]
MKTTDKSADALTDTFRGNDAQLVSNIKALLELDAEGALVPHGVGGHARTMLSAAAVRLAARHVEQHEAAPADAVRAYGVFRTRFDENDGKEFFHVAHWHNDYLPQEGERIVEGWFVPTFAAQAEPPAADERVAQALLNTGRSMGIEVAARYIDSANLNTTIDHAAEIRKLAARASSPNAAGAEGATFQVRVQPWMLACFGAEIAADRAERNHRFLEEALELVQACGCTASEAHQLVDYTFGRSVGEPPQEAGGVMVTLAALCLANGLDMHTAGETELARVWTKVEQIRAKQAAKPKHSPLPEAPAQAAEPVVSSDGINTWVDEPNQQVADVGGQPDGATVRCRRCGGKADITFSYAAAPPPAPASAPVGLTEEQPSLTNPLTPYGMLCRALRIIAGTLLGDMAKHLGCSSAMLSAVEFGRKPLTDAMVADTAAYFSTLGIRDTLHALNAARMGAKHE